MRKLNLFILPLSAMFFIATAGPIFANNGSYQNPRSSQAYQDDQDNDEEDADDEENTASCYYYNRRETCDCEEASLTQPGLYEFQQNVSWPGRNSETSDRLTR